MSYSIMASGRKVYLEPPKNSSSSPTPIQIHNSQHQSAGLKGQVKPSIINYTLRPSNCSAGATVQIPQPAAKINSGSFSCLSSSTFLKQNCSRGLKPSTVTSGSYNQESSHNRIMVEHDHMVDNNSSWMDGGDGLCTSEIEIAHEHQDSAVSDKEVVTDHIYNKFPPEDSSPRMKPEKNLARNDDMLLLIYKPLRI
jgi:hypothetical protein